MRRLAVLAALLLCPAAAAQSQPTLTVHASAGSVAGGTRVTLSGQTTPASTVHLYEEPYPFGAPHLAQTTTAAADGTFAFEVFPSRNTRYRVAIAGASASTEVDVIGKAIVKVRKLPLGQAMVTIVVFHPSDLDWAHRRVSWLFTSGGGHFAAQPATSTRPLSPYVVVLRTVVTLPAGRFRFRACFHAPGDHARLDPLRPPGCTGVG